MIAEPTCNDIGKSGLIVWIEVESEKNQHARICIFAAGTSKLKVENIIRISSRVIHPTSQKGLAEAKVAAQHSSIHQMNLNTKRFLAAVLGICAGTAALLGVGDASASNFSRYLLASDGDKSQNKSTTATSDAAATSSKSRVLKTMEGPSRPMRILKVEEGTTSDDDRELIYLKPTTASRSLKGTEGPSKGDMLRRVKEIMAHLDQHVESAGADSAIRSLHLLQLEFPDCVGLNEKECEATIMQDLEQNEALLTHLGGTTDDLQFEVRPKRHEDDVDHAKVVILTDDSGTQVVGTNGDSIVHYPYKVSENAMLRSLYMCTCTSVHNMHFFL